MNPYYFVGIGERTNVTDYIVFILAMLTGSLVAGTAVYMFYSMTLIGFPLVVIYGSISLLFLYNAILPLLRLLHVLPYTNDPREE